ncbi:EamA family transporter [Neokomagataea tanensis]|uniref:EamA family transporter n=1 Tax=Neokomagataea tanensis TaxID=661191 RepID=A0A4Y6V7G4_9PROT|nr:MULTISPECIES: EamA family transporter [Neokomagataea]QDH24466.1 EamA family transporter [Neokomagataea tanensis]
MMTFDSLERDKPAVLGAGFIVCSLIAQNIGAAFAKHLFLSVGPYGVAVLRIGLSAILLLALRRPWRRSIPQGIWPYVVLYGVMLGVMNSAIYQAFARIPLGVALGIEVSGPVLLGLLGSRRWIDFCWMALIVFGLILLLPLHVQQALDPLGVVFAFGAGACWAFYVLCGKRVAPVLGGDAAAIGMTVAMMVTAPIGLIEAGSSLMQLNVWAVGLAVAILSSAIPYSLEVKALRLLPAHVFGMLLSAAPAIGALAGFVILGETLTWLQVAAIFCVTFAAAGSALTVRPAGA